MTQAWGETLQQAEAKEVEQANSMTEQTESRRAGKIDLSLGESLDRIMIFIRGEEWKELKCAVF